MSTIQYRKRARAHAPESLEAAWDAGLPPPADACEAKHRDTVVDCFYFRWADTGRWPRCEHPYFGAWLGALEAGRAARS